MRKIALLAALAAISLTAFQATADDAPAKSEKDKPAQEAPAKGSDQAKDAPKQDPSGPLPRLVIESTEHQFGEVPAGTALEYSFEIKNTGDADLQILKVKPACGCTTSEFDTTIASGATGHITLAVKHTTNYKGPVAKSARVDTNDPLHPIMNLVLRATFPKPETDAKADPAEKTAPKAKDKPKEDAGSGR